MGESGGIIGNKFNGNILETEPVPYFRLDAFDFYQHLILDLDINILLETCCGFDGFVECSSPSNGNVIVLDFSDGPMSVEAKPAFSAALTFV